MSFTIKIRITTTYFCTNGGKAGLAGFVGGLAGLVGLSDPLGLDLYAWLP